MRLFAFAAGAGILLAQLAWNRQLLLIVGGSVDAAAAVLSSFMLGLGLGGRYFGRKSELSKSPAKLLRYTVVAVAVFSLLPLALAPFIKSVYPVFYNSGINPIPVRFAISILMIFPATFFAGGIIPILGRLSEERGGDREVSRLYGLNALGSAVGGFLSGFILLELTGGPMTMLIGAVVTASAVIFIPKQMDSSPVKLRLKSSERPASFYLVIFALSGMVALGYEMIWARQFTFVLGNSTYAFSIMGIIVLTGIGIGGIFGQRLSARTSSPFLLLGGVEVLLGLASILPLTALSAFTSVAGIIQGSSWFIRTASLFATAFLYMLPSAFLMGTTFPLIIRSATNPDRLGNDTGFMSMANCIGAAAGPILTGGILFHYFGVTKSAFILAIGSVLIGFLIFIREKKFIRATGVLVCIPLIVFLTEFSNPPGSIPPEGMELLFFEEDRMATVSVFGREWDNYRSLRINGVEEVPIDQASLEAFYLLGHLPWGYNPAAEKVMVVAMGGGITSGALLSHPIDTLVCVELCPAVLNAAEIFSAENNRSDLDPRFHLIADDGRNFLLGTQTKFDLIVCDATHPGSSDSWVLYTREFYSTMMNTLVVGGVAAQWVPLHQLPVSDLRRILATWSSVFPYSAVHTAGGRHAILIGSNTQLQLSMEAIFADSIALHQLTQTGFSQDEPEYLTAIMKTEDFASINSGFNTDAHSHCQFIRRRVPLDPQATIAPAIIEIFAIGHENIDPVRAAQVLYWNGKLPEALELIRNAPVGIMRNRWLAVILTTVAEQLYMAGHRSDAITKLEEAVQADSIWKRHLQLMELIEIETINEGY